MKTQKQQHLTKENIMVDFSKFDIMVTPEETFCEEWDALCKADWLAVQEEIEMEDAVDEANAEMLEELEYEREADCYGAEWENHAERDWD
jgi:hypothetical protein